VRVPCLIGSFIGVLLIYLFVPVSIICGENIDKDLQKQLEQEILNKSLIIRNFYSGNALEYDSDGKLKSGGSPGIWTINGYFQPSKIKLSEKSLILSGQRLYWVYDYDKKSKKESEHFFRGSNVTIRVARTPECNTLPGIGELLRKVFLASNEPLEDHVPVYWKNLIRTKPKALPGDINEVSAELKASQNTDKEPRILFNPKPPYSEEARRVRLAGTMAMKVLITEEGKVVVQDILRPLGAGLDESAIKACETWKFSPALLNGSPVKMVAVIEVSYTIH